MRKRSRHPADRRPDSATRRSLVEQIVPNRSVGPPSRTLLSLLGVAAAGLASAPSLASADGQASAANTVPVSAPGAAPAPPASPPTATPAAGTAAPSTAPAIGSRPGRARTPTRPRRAPRVARQFSQPGGAAPHAPHPSAPAHHHAPALHPPKSAPAAPKAPTAPTPVVTAPAPAALLVAQQAPPAATNAALGFFRIPLFLLPVYQAAGDEYGIPWQVLAAINEVETDYGYNESISSAGAEGWMQFMPATWKLFGTDATGSGFADPYNPADAIFAAARYLHAAGAQTDLKGAIYAYNHSSDYVNSVLLRAKLIEVYPQAMIDGLTALSVGMPPVAGNDPGHLTSQPAAPRPPAAPSSSHATTRATASGPGATSSSSLPPTPAAAAAGVTSSPATSSAAPAGAGRAGTVSLHTRPNSAVVAVKDGRVLHTGRSQRLGGYVTVQDAQGDLFTYGHLARVGTRGRAGRPTTQPGATAAAAPTGAVRVAAGDGPLQVRVAPSAAVRALAGAATPTTPPGAVSPSAWQAIGTQAPSVSGALRMLGYAPLAARPPLSTAVAVTAALPSWSAPSASGWLPLRAGQTLWAGSVLGQAPSSGVIRFAVTPSGASAPVDARPFLAAWRLRSQILGAAPALGAGQTPGAGQTLGAGQAGTSGASNALTASAFGAPVSAQQLAAAGGSTAGASAAAASATTAGASASSAISHRTPNASVHYDLSSWGQDRMFFLSRARLEHEVLTDRRVHLYACGRQDIAHHRIDGRVLAVLEFLADSGLHPTVSALECGHSLRTTSGNVSEHSTGDAVDVSAINGVPILGHQGPGSITEITIGRLMALRGSFVPHQVISLMAYPEASNTLSLPDHYNHIHIGFRPTATASASAGSATATIASTAASAGTPPLTATPADIPGLAATPTLSAAQWQRLVRHLQANGNPLLAPLPTNAAIADPSSSGAAQPGS